VGFFNFLFKKKPTHTSLSDRLKESGNVFMMLFAAVGMVGVIGASTMTVMKGPVRTMSQVTKRTIAENNMIAAGKLALIASGQNVTINGDCDTDSTVEPIPFVTTVGSISGGGTLPVTIGVAKKDPWGTEYGYCTWDHGAEADGTCGASSNFRVGANVPTEYVLAIVSAGPDRNFNTSCDDYTAPGTSILNKTGGSDDIILGYTYAEAGALAGGLWVDDAGTAKIATDIIVDDGSGNTLNFDAALGNFAIGGTGSGQFPTTKTDNLQSYGGAGGTITVDSALNSSQNITTTGDISGANLIAGGTLNVTGVSTLGTVNAGNTAVSGTLGATGATTLGGTLGVTGISTLDVLNAGATGVSSLTSGGSIIANGTGNIVLKSNYLTGDGTGDDGITIDAAGNVTGSGNIIATNALNSATLATTGNATIGGTLGVTGTTTLGVLSAGVTTLGATTLSGDLTIGNNLITGLGAPTADAHAATKKYVDDNISAGTGYSETDPEVDTLTANKWCVANAGGTAIDCTANTPSSTGDDLGNHTATTALDLATNKIVNLADPTLAQDAATKAYVDASGGSDNLGNHTATTALDMANFTVDSAGLVNFTGVAGAIPVNGSGGGGGSSAVEVTLMDPVINNSGATAAHGLGSTPASVSYYLENKIAELSYSVGDRVHLARNEYVTIFSDATNIGVQVENSGLFINRKNTSATATGINPASWKLVAVINGGGSGGGGAGYTDYANPTHAGNRLYGSNPMPHEIFIEFCKENGHIGFAIPGSRVTVASQTLATYGIPSGPWGTGTQTSSIDSVRCMD
jgi:hypothetical protein